MDFSSTSEYLTFLGNQLTGPDALPFFLLLFGSVAFLAGFFACVLIVFIGDLCEIFHAAVPLIKRSINERKAKKSGKLTMEQRLELLEDKIDSLADIVISSSSEVK